MSENYPGCYILLMIFSQPAWQAMAFVAAGLSYHRNKKIKIAILHYFCGFGYLMYRLLSQSPRNNKSFKDTLDTKLW